MQDDGRETPLKISIDAKIISKFKPKALKEILNGPS
jgi:hypothetical protein